MATTQFSSQLHHKRDETKPNMTWGLFIAATSLALLIGLSAVDVQRQRTVDNDQAQNLGQDSSQFDGRGKWAGYM